MKKIGIALMVIGGLWALIAFNADTTVTTESQVIGEMYIPSQKVNNIGKMDDRRNHLMLSGLLVIVGVVLFAVGNFKTPSNQIQPLNVSFSAAGTRKCPFCAELVKAEAIICRFCQREIPPVQSPSQSNMIEASANPTLTSSKAEELPMEQHQLMEQHGITYDGEKYHFFEYRYDKFSDALNYALLQARRG